MSTRNRRANIPQAENILGEYLIDKDTRKITNAITILDRRFYDSLYPEYNPKDTLNEKFSRLLVAEESLKQKETLELFLLSREIADV